MRESRESVALSGFFTDLQTGEVSDFHATKEILHKHYSIKRLNMKIWDVGLDWVGNKVIKSNLDYRIFTAIKQSLNRHNEFRKNVTELALEIGTTGSNMRKMLKKLCDINFLYRVERGVYLANPFVIKAKGMTNIECEELQTNWKTNVGEPTEVKLHTHNVL
jgi:hypothetical protein